MVNIYNIGDEIKVKGKWLDIKAIYNGGILLLEEGQEVLAQSSEIEEHHKPLNTPINDLNDLY